MHHNEIYVYLSVYTVRTENLNRYHEFVDMNYRQFLSHSKTRWLPLFFAGERLLHMFPGVKSIFLSYPNPLVLLKYLKMI
jgi:succinate dehydrogenase hydrophobic anchor subunit